MGQRPIDPRGTPAIGLAAILRKCIVGWLDHGRPAGRQSKSGQGRKAGTARAGAPARRPGTRDTQARFGQSFSQIIAVLMRDQNSRTCRSPICNGWSCSGDGGAVPGWRTCRHLPAPGEPKPDEKSGYSSPSPSPLGPGLAADRQGAVGKSRQARAPAPPIRASGNIVWLMAVAGDRRAIPKFLEQLKEKEFKGQEVKMRANAAATAKWSSRRSEPGFSGLPATLADGRARGSVPERPSTKSSSTVWRSGSPASGCAQHLLKSWVR